MRGSTLHPLAEGLVADTWDEAVDRDEGDGGDSSLVSDGPLPLEAAANPSGLSSAHRIVARDLACAAAILGYHNRGAVHYTQGASRWQGIATNRKAYKGQYPNEADCSAYVTWSIWNGLDHYGVRDTVNGLHWAGGYTGTMATHGVRSSEWLMRGDYAIYGTAWPYHHTAIYVGGGMVISHGSERGPLYLPLRYRSDLAMMRRAI